MDKRAKKYIKLKYRKNRSALSVALDAVFFYCAVFLIIFIFMWSMNVPFKASLIYAFIFSLTLFLICRKVNKERFLKFSKRLKDKTAKKIALYLFLSSSCSEELFAPAGYFKKAPGIYYLNGKAVFIKLKFNLTEDDVLDCARLSKGCSAREFLIISPAEPIENTLFLLESLGGALSREPINEYIRNNPPDKALIEKELIREYENSKISKEKLRESFLNNTGAGAWYLCSLFILIWGIIFKKSGIYYLSAAICSFMGLRRSIYKRNSGI